MSNSLGVVFLFLALMFIVSTSRKGYFLNCVNFCFEKNKKKTKLLNYCSSLFVIIIHISCWNIIKQNNQNNARRKFYFHFILLNFPKFLILFFQFFLTKKQQKRQKVFQPDQKAKRKRKKMILRLYWTGLLKQKISKIFVMKPRNLRI